MTINDVGRIGPQDNELEAIKKRNADLQFCLDKEVARVMALTEQNAELLEELDYQKRHVNVGTEGHVDHALAIKDLDHLRPFYTREGAINLIKEHWPDLIQLYIQRDELLSGLNSHRSNCMRSKAYRKLHWPCTCEAIAKAGGA